MLKLSRAILFFLLALALCSSVTARGGDVASNFFSMSRGESFDGYPIKTELKVSSKFMQLAKVRGGRK